MSIRSTNASTYLHLRRMIDSCFMAAAAAEAGLERPSVVLRPLTGTSGPKTPHASLEPDRATYPASMIKVPIAAALAVLCGRGAARLDDPVRVDAGAVTVNDAPSPFELGYRTTLGESAHAMLAWSDNVATNLLIDALGRDRITAVVRDDLGLATTAVRRKLSGALPLIDDSEATGRNVHPASEAAALLAVVAAERTGRCAFVFDALLAQIWNDKLPRGLRAGDVFAHKTGDTDEVSHDGGILTLADGRSFVLVVYTALPASAESDARIAAFGRLLRDALERA
jgi:beta-lactamase class A